MVTTFSLLIVNFGFNGITEAIVQRDEVSHELASTLFWINCGVGVALTGLFMLSGTLLAELFHNPLVRGVVIGISPTIIATSLPTVHLALLKRAMRFSTVSINDVVGKAMSVLVSIVLAELGWGYWALIAGAITLPVSVAIGALILCRWLPGLPRAVEGTGSSLRFAINTYGNFGINYFSRNVDNLLVGWKFNAQALGFYKKAYDLFALAANQLVSSLTIVVVAGLSRVAKDKVRYRRYLLDAISVMAFAGMALAAILTVIGQDLIFVLLGPKWAPAGRIFSFFGPGVGIMILYQTHSWIHLSIGRPERWFRWSIIEFAATLTLFLVGIHWGPDGIAVAWSLSFCLLTIPAIAYAGAPVSLHVGAVLSVAWRYLLASIMAVATILLLRYGFPNVLQWPGIEGALARMMIEILLVSVAYLLAVIILHGSLRPLVRFAGLLRDLIPAGRKSRGDSVSLAPFSLPTDTVVTDLPLVSILIPAYNAERWIAKTLESALQQTWPRTEIIVVDDGSKDRTVEIARTFEEQGVRIVTERNQGAAAARNHAYSLSKGDYIQWLDADDLLSPDKIARQMHVVMEGVSKYTLLSSSWAHFMYRPEAARFVPSELWRDLTPREWLLRKMKFNIYMQTSTWLVSRALTEAAGPWNVRMLGDDDGEYFCRVLLKSDGIRFVPESRVYYRAFRFDSLSYVGRFPEKIEAHWASMKLHIGYLRSLGDFPESRAASVQFLRDSLIYFYPEREDIVAQAEQLALELGAEVGRPVLSWKYVWLEKVVGWRIVKMVQRVLRRLRWRTEQRIDWLLYVMENKLASYSSGSVDPACDGEPLSTAVTASITKLSGR